jgi:hypothetical protein
MSASTGKKGMSLVLSSRIRLFSGFILAASGMANDQGMPGDEYLMGRTTSTYKPPDQSSGERAAMNKDFMSRYPLPAGDGPGPEDLRGRVVMPGIPMRTLHPGRDT